MLVDGVGVRRDDVVDDARERSVEIHASSWRVRRWATAAAGSAGGGRRRPTGRACRVLTDAAWPPPPLGPRRGRHYCLVGDAAPPRGGYWLSGGATGRQPGPRGNRWSIPRRTPATIVPSASATSAVAAGWRRVRQLRDDMDDGRRRRLARLGFPPGEAAELSALHTRNFM